MGEALLGTLCAFGVLYFLVGLVWIIAYIFLLFEIRRLIGTQYQP